jgi:acetate kinase
MLILTINAGSSSIRCKLIKLGKTPQTLATAHADAIGLKTCHFTFSSKNSNISDKQKINSHHEAIEKIIKELLSSNTIKDKSEIKAIGHRVVHGGEKYSSAVKIDRRVVKEIKKLIPLAPLHNPHNLEGILACQKIFPKSKQVAVFDTAFHQTIPETAFLYGLPYSWYSKKGIRRYGFHGTSHKYVTNSAIKLLKKPKAKIISCHLGNGASITATLKGKSINNSMGFTPLEGVVMGTRSGSIDPGIIFHAAEKLKIPLAKIKHILNEESGLKGLFGKSSDMRDIRDAYYKKDPAAARTLEVFSHSVMHYVGAYIAELNGLDALVFTGGIGEHAHYVRTLICNQLSYLGLKLDNKKNESDSLIISSAKSKIKVLVIPTNEELQIALEASLLINAA